MKNCFLLVALLFLTIKCSSVSRNIVQNQSSDDLSDVGRSRDKTFYGGDTLRCDGNTEVLPEFKNIEDEHYTLEANFKKCLCENSFWSSDASEFLAKYILFLNKNKYTNTGVCPFFYKLRGRNLFGVLLDVSRDFDCYYSDFGDTNFTRVRDLFLFSIKTIGDKDVFDAYKDYLDDKFHNPTYDIYMRYDLGIKGCSDDMVEIQKIQYDFFKTAWEEGRIVLKDFGEE